MSTKKNYGKNKKQLKRRTLKSRRGKMIKGGQWWNPLSWTLFKKKEEVPGSVDNAVTGNISIANAAPVPTDENTQVSTDPNAKQGPTDPNAQAVGGRGEIMKLLRSNGMNGGRKSSKNRKNKNKK